MNIVLDTHIHTIACNHAYSTIEEITKVADEKDLKLICITEHGPMLPGGPHPYFFANIRVVPTEMNGVKILKGIESNIIDYDGKLDLPEEYEDRMEIVLAGLHDMILPAGSKRDNTKAVIKTMENQIVDIIVHIGNPAFEVDYDDVLKAAKDTMTFIEINNSSFVHSRKGSYYNCRTVAEKCAHWEIPVSLGSDAHISVDVGDFSEALDMLDSIGFPKEELVINYSEERLMKYLSKKGKKLLVDPRNKQ
ncbi:MAG: phosphatase [Eubacteriales bacterium]